MGKRRFSNIRSVTVDNIRFASPREADRYAELKLLLCAKIIKKLEIHPRIPIVIGDIEIRIYSKRYHLNGRPLIYEADFRYYDNEKGRTIIEDVKMQSGHRTEIYILKRALVNAMGLHIVEV